MTEPRHILFALLHCGLHPGDDRVVGRFAHLFDSGQPTPDWQAVYKLAAKQGVLAVAGDGLQRLADAGVLTTESLPVMLRLQWIANIDIIEKRYRRQRQAIARLAGFYARHDIEMLILKGYGLSLCYPVPEHRPCGDVDMWLFGRQQEADDLLRREKGIEIDVDKHHHTVFAVGGVTFENHYDFLNTHSHLSNREIERILPTTVRSEQCAIVEGEGSRAALPPVNFNALFLLRHTAGHFAAENIGLRHVSDWAMFVERYGGQIDWQRLERIAREHNMHRFLHSLNAMAVECTGVDASLFAGAGSDDKRLTARILNDILSPEFSERKPAGTLWRRYSFKLRRWLANRWKRSVVYRDGDFRNFIAQTASHLKKPDIPK